MDNLERYKTVNGGCQRFQFDVAVLPSVDCGTTALAESRATRRMAGFRRCGGSLAQDTAFWEVSFALGTYRRLPGELSSRWVRQCASPYVAPKPSNHLKSATSGYRTSFGRVPPCHSAVRATAVCGCISHKAVSGLLRRGTSPRSRLYVPVVGKHYAVTQGPVPAFPITPLFIPTYLDAQRCRHSPYPAGKLMRTADRS